MHAAYFRPGGVHQDMPDNCRRYLTRSAIRSKVVDDLDNLLTGNRIFNNATSTSPSSNSKTPGTAGFSGRDGARLGRGGGICASRSLTSGYNELDFRHFTIGKNGDCYDRYLIRMEEMRQSPRIMKQCLEKLRRRRRRGPVAVDDNKIVPPMRDRDEALDGSADPPLQALHRGLSRAGRRGLRRGRSAEGRSSAVYLSPTAPTAVQVQRFAPPGFALCKAMDWLCKGHLLADVSAILGSIDIVFGEVDR